MKIAFHGAARTVTGSKHLITLKMAKKFYLIVACSRVWGEILFHLTAILVLMLSSVNYLLLSHAHIDHCGLIPKLVKEGFTGKIFCTPATKDLAASIIDG